MNVLINIGYETFGADLSGAELEAFTRTINKLKKTNHKYVPDGQSYYHYLSPEVKCKVHIEWTQEHILDAPLPDPSEDPTNEEKN